VSAEHLAPVQLINFVIGAGAFVTLICLRDQRLGSALLAGLAGFAFFPGFIYLFHLHGVFYSPVLLGISVFVLLFERRDRPGFTDVAAVCVAAIAYCFHPYAMLVFGGMYVGLWLSRICYDRDQLAPVKYVLGATILAVAVLSVVWVKPSSSSLSLANVRAAFTSFRGMEQHWVATAIGAGFAFVSLADLSRCAVTPLVAYGGLVGALVGLGVPGILVWGVAGLARSLVLGQFPLAGLVAASLALPMISPTGSPTYAVFAVYAGIAATSKDNALFRYFERPFMSWVGLTCGVVAVALIVLLRVGVEVPVVSRFARPLLAEREKTFQLERIVGWWSTSEHRGRTLVLNRNASQPFEESGTLPARRFRPPTYQGYLDAYARLRSNAGAEPGRLVLGFGGEVVPSCRPVLEVVGRFADKATACLPD
jgi:hypothetical protein